MITTKLTTAYLVKIAKEKGITKWRVRECASCGYPVTFRIQSEKEIHFSEACHCSQDTHRPEYKPSSWDDILLTIQGLTDFDEIKHAKELWNIS